MSTRTEPAPFEPTSIIGNSLFPVSAGFADPHVPDSRAQATCSPAAAGALMEMSIVIVRGSWTGVTVIDPNPLFGMARPSSELALLGLKRPLQREGRYAPVPAVAWQARVATIMTSITGVGGRIESMVGT